MRSFLRLALALTCLALAGCEQLSMMTNPMSSEPVAYGPETEKQIEKSSKRYATLLQAMDAEGLSKMYSPDGEIGRAHV